MRHIGMHAQQACGHTAAAQLSGRASQLLTAAYGHAHGAETREARRALSCDENRPMPVDSGYQLLMLDGLSTIADDPVVCGALRLRTALQ